MMWHQSEIGRHLILHVGNTRGKSVLAVQYLLGDIWSRNSWSVLDMHWGRTGKLRI